MILSFYKRTSRPKIRRTRTKANRLSMNFLNARRISTPNRKPLSQWLSLILQRWSSNRARINPCQTCLRRNVCLSMKKSTTNKRTLSSPRSVPFALSRIHVRSTRWVRWHRIKLRSIEQNRQPRVSTPKTRFIARLLLLLLTVRSQIDFALFAVEYVDEQVSRLLLAKKFVDEQQCADQQSQSEKTA